MGETARVACTCHGIMWRLWTARSTMHVVCSSWRQAFMGKETGLKRAIVITLVITELAGLAFGVWLVADAIYKLVRRDYE